MAQHETALHSLDDIPAEIVERLMNDHHLSWVSLSSDYRFQEDATPSFRQPDFASWIKLD
ncbi:hypothetical protein BEP19_02090 [Ammoniphilus oxalaticus]|uniref:Uncharacterized protein n=1 Tax=Ammoniphilus oxalaticus TaxID=66863 RepID=A0A419SN97_9BACL|nr:hypothetical protein [Ammoniphilus oxalaticus]RKD25755.1 hypothetical protein BEP19_02090 [Ammoniphilus oxalaticus]